ncbi:pilus assembly [Chlorella sorokiniana]|uniref:Pilus assembly n=1 Tax=Chlorella sorokiniana TaxID=3076 RepID=A0A2P6TPF8_CHLSO|nr:pilus assembly [Chlorella sorokiniana]|eukprot:PRW55918.1 pilus assembly [Chlorella sorokiniana]
MPASNQPRFSDLPHDLLQRVAGLLGDEDRLAMLDVCSGWAAAIEAAPALWPTAVLSMPPTKLNGLELRQGVLSVDSSLAADLRPATRLTGLELCIRGAQHLLQLCQALPALRELSYSLGWADLQPELLLQVAALLGNEDRLAMLDVCSGWAAAIEAAPALWPTAVLALPPTQLTELNLGSNHMSLVASQPGQVDSLGSSLVADLSPATRLTSLALRIRGAQHLLELCRALPALRELSLDVYWCENEDGQQVVAILQQLPQLTLSCGFHGYNGTEVTMNDYLQDEVWEMTELPPMAGLHLTALQLYGAMATPPDLVQLPHLQSLKLHYVHGHHWGHEPLTGLASLSRLELAAFFDPDETALAAAPRLAVVHAPSTSNEWRARLAALRPDVHLTPAPEAEQQ